MLKRDMLRSSSIAALVLLFLSTSPANAHHSIVAFDQDTFLELEGTIETLRWRNPHVGFTLVVEDDSGERQEWEMEGDSLNAMLRRGLTRESISPGTRVRIAGWPSLFGRQEVFAINVLLPSGEEFVMTDLEFPLRWTDEENRVEAAFTETGADQSIFRTWSYSALYEPRAPFAYTEAAEAARSAFNPFTDTPSLRCIPPGMPNAMLNPYPIEFINEGDQISLRIEEWEAVRTIDMSTPEIPADAPRNRLGYSVGRWEGDTLVVRTAHVDFPYLDDEGTPLGASAQMIERFSVSEDGLYLDYEITVIDPENLAEPAVWDAQWKWVPGTRIRAFECDL